MGDIDDEVTAALQARLHRTLALLHRAHQVRDGLAAERAEMEREMGTASSDVLTALDHAEKALLAVEADMLAAMNTLLAGREPQVHVMRRHGGQI